mgnify:CR=1 FL=1
MSPRHRAVGLRFLKPTMQGWARAWSVIAARYGGDPLCWNKDAEEGWQYLSTVEGQHEFRHRAFPPNRPAAQAVTMGGLVIQPDEDLAWRRVYEEVPARDDDWRDIKPVPA